MNFELSSSQLELQRVARRFFGAELPTHETMPLALDQIVKHSTDMWRKMAALGWLGLPFPSQYGGGGASLIELGVLFAEGGRALLPTTFQTTINAGLLAAAIGTDEQKERLLTPIAQGKMVATVALAEATAIHEVNYLKTTATCDGKDWIVRGSKIMVANADVADTVLVIARLQRQIGSAGIGAFVISRTQLSIEPLSGLGATPFASIEFNNVRVPDSSMLGSDSDDARTVAALSSVGETMTVLHSMDCVGGAEKVLDSTVAYVKAREQFGSQVGSFQAVQHHVANLRIGLDAAWLASLQALWLLSTGAPATREVAIAKLYAADAYTSTTLLAHQLWGGIGYMKETGLYRWSERAKVGDLLFGPPHVQLERIAKQLQI